MNIDIRVNVNFFEHPKTLKLIRRAGYEAVVCLQRLWCYAARLLPDGVLRDMDAEDLAVVSGWGSDAESFVSVLVDLRWLDVVDGCYVIHDWAENNAYAADSSQRSDRGRFNRMAQTHPGLHRELLKQGLRSITAEEYRRLTSGLSSAKAVVEAVVKQQPAPGTRNQEPETLKPSSSSPTPSPPEAPPSAAGTPDDDDDQKPVGNNRMNPREFATRYHETMGVLMPPALNEEVRRLLGRYPRDRLREAFLVTAEKGGRTFAYLKKVVENGAGGGKKAVDWSFLEEAGTDRTTRTDETYGHAMLSAGDG